MARIEIDVTIDRPVGEVYRVMADPDRLPEWATGALEVEHESGNPGEGSVGARYTQISTFLGRRIEVAYQVTRVEPNRRFSFRSVSGPIPFEFDYRFQPSGSGTKVRVTFEGEPGGLFKMAEPVLVALARRQFMTNMENLKDLMEVGALVAVPA